MLSPLWITLIVLAVAVVALMFERVSPEVVMVAGLVVLVMTGVLDSNSAWSGFANQSVVALASLFVVGAGLRSTGALEYVGRKILGDLKSAAGLARTTAPVALLSAFVNNTPIVAIFMPMFVTWSKRKRISPSRVLLPLSFAAMLGGTCTLIGTSTNLVVHEVMQTHDPAGRGMSMFEISWVGLPIVFFGMLYMSTIGKRLLPDRADLLERIESHPREYTVELIVLPDCPFAGKSVRKSGLRDLPGLYLFRIERGSQVFTPVTPEDRIEVGDLLHFSGIISTVVDLQKQRGLAPVDHRSLNFNIPNSLDSMEGIPDPPPVQPAKRTGRMLCEVVISSFSPLVGRTIKDANFRAQYNASVLAVHRTGHKLQQKIGQVVLQPGDTLLVDVDEDFAQRWRNSPDFVLIAGVEDSAPVIHERTWLALAIFGAVVLGMSFWSTDPAVPALAGAVAMVLTGCVSSSAIPQAVELPLLLLVGAALGIGKGMQASGADAFLAENMLAVAKHFGDIGILAGIFFVTSLLSQFLSNNATAALMGSLAVATAEQFQIDARPLLMTVAVAASSAFATPIGYQTNMMVRNAGGYRFIDYVRVGLPLTIFSGVITVFLVPFVWPLR